MFPLFGYYGFCCYLLTFVYNCFVYRCFHFSWVPLYLSTYLHIYLLGQMVTPYFTDREPQNCFLKWLHQFMFPPVEHEWSDFSTCSATLVIFCPSGCEVVTCVVLICMFLMTYDVEHLFIYSLSTYISSFEKFLFRPFAYFFTLLYIFIIINYIIIFKCLF